MEQSFFLPEPGLVNTSTNPTRPENAQILIMSLCAGEMVGFNTSEVGVAEACACLNLSLGNGDEETPACAPVSYWLQRLWISMAPTEDSSVRKVAGALAQHLKIPSRKIPKGDLFSTIVNHLKIVNREELFCCSLSIPGIAIGQELSAMTISYLEDKKLRPLSHVTYITRMHMLKTHKRKHADKQTGRKGTEAEGDSIEKMMGELDAVFEDQPEPREEDRYAITSSSTVEKRIEGSQSISKNIQVMINENRLDQLASEISTAMTDIGQRLEIIRSERLSKQEKNPEGQAEENEIEVDINDVEPERLSEEIEIVNCLDSNRIRTVPFQVKVENSNIHNDEEYNLARKLIEDIKYTETNYLDIFNDLKAFCQDEVSLASEFFNVLKQNKSLPASALAFLKSNQTKLEIVELNAQHINRLNLAHVLPHDLSLNEIQNLSNYEEDESVRLDNMTYCQPPSSLTITQEMITDDLLKYKSGIIIGHSGLYRSLYYYPYTNGPFLLNFASPNHLMYNGKADDNNQLLGYVLETIRQMSLSESKPPILIEFYPSKYGSQCTLHETFEDILLFMQTMKIIQEYYSGSIVALAPPVYYFNGTPLATYQEIKGVQHKIARAMKILGYAQSIVVINPLIATLPIYKPCKPETRGFIVDIKQKFLPIFDDRNNYSAEACKRSLRCIRADLDFLEELGRICDGKPALMNNW
jgi:hypothetical protein